MKVSLKQSKLRYKKSFEWVKQKNANIWKISPTKRTPHKPQKYPKQNKKKNVNINYFVDNKDTTVKPKQNNEKRNPVLMMTEEITIVI